MFAGGFISLALPRPAQLALQVLGFAADVLDTARNVLGRPAPREPSPLALACMRELVLRRGIRPLQDLAYSVERSVADEYAAALMRLTEKLAKEGYAREAEQVFFLLSGDWR
jgi:hypothetical protein